MSYILDALKKSQKPVAANINFNDSNYADDDQNQDAASKVSDKRARTPLRKSLFSGLSGGIILLIAISSASFILGYLANGGLDIISYHVNRDNTKLSNMALEPEFVKPTDEELTWPKQRTPHQDAAFFQQPNRFNKKLITKKQDEARQAQLAIIAKEQEEERKQQAYLAAQVERVIKAQGILAPSQPVNEQLAETTNKINKNEDISLDTSQLEGVSPDLLKAFQSAIEEEKLQPNNVHNQANEQPPVAKENRTSQSNIQAKPLTQMPQWLQNSVPPLRFSLHMYSSDRAKSWVRLNNEDYNPGDVTREGLVIEDILPQQVVLQYRGETFTLKAMSSW